ncbi:MAG: hypothetical protein ACRYG7_08810 [Janthinobacterium lividum]
MTEASLLADLNNAVRSAGDRGLTTADDLRGFLTVLIKELVGRTGSAGLAAPNGLGYGFIVDNDGTLHVVPTGNQALADFNGLLTASNGLTYRLTVANDGTLGTVPSDGLMDADAAAFIAAAGLQNVAHQQAVNDLIRALKVGNVWPRLRAAYPMVGGTEQAHRLNLKDPRDADEAFRLTFINSPLHSELGVGWNGVDQYADTHFVPANQLAQSNNHMCYYATTEADSTGRTEVEIGTHDASYFSLSLRYQGGMNYDTNHSSKRSAGPDSGLGFGIGSQENATTISLYRAGKLLAVRQVIGQLDDYPAASLLLGRRQEGYFSQKTCGFAAVGDGLSQAEAKAYSAAVASFQQALGRAIEFDVVAST